MIAIPIVTPTDTGNYELIDSGNNKKFEAFGGYSIVRPDPRILWLPKQNHDVWDSADAVFDPAKNGWITKKTPPHPWEFRYKSYRFTLQTTDFRHVGVFPEQSVNWDFLEGKLAGKNASVLNLFGYTGAATVVAARKGARVTHVDGSKPALTWARENFLLNHCAESNVRWIYEDAMKFALREAKRGNTYDGIIMDPPRFGRGSKGEVWKLGENLPKLLSTVKTLLSEKAGFLILNVYTADLSAIAMYQLAHGIIGSRGGSIEASELTLKEKDTNRLLPQGILVRWER